MKSPRRFSFLLLVALPLAACTAIGGRGERALASRPTDASGAASEAATSSNAWSSGDAVLYARDGKPVGDPDASQGGASASELAHDPTHAIGASEGGRMYILELYQKVIEERDALTLEVTSLRGEGERMRTALADAERRIAELEARSAVSEQQRDTLRAENVELAGRLTTAQIRRLQAEKMLLELRIAQQRALQGATQLETTREPARKP